MTSKTLYTLLFCLIINSIACNRQSISDGRKTREQFISSVRSFPYRASDERKARLVENYPKLSVGMSKSQIAAALGEPDYSSFVAGKALMNYKGRGSEWVYCLYSNHPFVGTSPNDEHITIFFDLDDRARWIIPEGLRGLEQIGQP